MLRETGDTTMRAIAKAPSARASRADRRQRCGVADPSGEAQRLLQIPRPPDRRRHAAVGAVLVMRGNAFSADPDRVANDARLSVAQFLARVIHAVFLAGSVLGVPASWPAMPVDLKHGDASQRTVSGPARKRSRTRPAASPAQGTGTATDARTQATAHPPPRHPRPATRSSWRPVPASC